MANYKSQFTGEQIDEAIGKVLNATNIYNYDGTVIIEKGESPLGSRRFKENPNSLDQSIITSLEDGFNQYGFSITDVEVEGSIINGLTCTFKPIGVEGNITIMRFVVDGNIHYEAVQIIELALYGLSSFNVISTANATVDEWLLANTEGVSV